MSDSDEITEALRAVRSWIDEAASIAVLTGAGISTDSGIPDFRGPQGLWTKDPDAEKMATLQVYVSDPEVRKRSWQWRLETERNKREPNRGHAALVELERRGKLDTLVTQNVDGLHQAAGSDPARVVEIHGTLQEVQCLDCEERAPMSRALARVEAGEEDPPCRTCGGMLKSATISFGQGLVARDPRARPARGRDLRSDPGDRHDPGRLSDRRDGPDRQGGRRARRHRERRDDGDGRPRRRRPARLDQRDPAPARRLGLSRLPATTSRAREPGRSRRLAAPSRPSHSVFSTMW